MQRSFDNLIFNMGAPSKLAIATSSVNRLVKEEASYHKEVEQQEARIVKLEQANGDEYELKQEVCSDFGLPVCEDSRSF